MDETAPARTSLGADGESGTEHFVHISFATPNFSQSLELLRKTAVRRGVRDFRAYTPEHPVVRRAAEENAEIFALKRGAGYWLWKPYILLDALDSVPEGTLVVYTDAGLCYVGKPDPLAALAQNRDIVLFRNNARGRQSTWTKRDCFVLMKADTPEYWQQSHLDASVQMYRAGATARRFLDELKLAMRDPRILTDRPNECGLPNLEDFIDHRHDQSVLTILAHRHGIVPQRCPKRLPFRNRARFEPNAVFEHHRARNLSPIRYRWQRVLEVLGIRGVAHRRRIRAKPARPKS